MDMNSLTCSIKVLPYFKGPNIILGLLVLKKSNVIIHPSLNSFTMGDYKIWCHRESRRIFCLIVDTDKMNQRFAEHTLNKKDPLDFLLIFLHFAEELKTVRSDFGE